MDPVNHLRTYDVAELERIAHEQLSKLGSGFTIPPDIDYIIEQLPGVDLDYYPALRDNYGLDGMVGLDLDTGEIIIYIDETLATSESLPRRYRMTVAEELAHLVLHRKAIESVRESTDFQGLHKLGNWYDYERNAKRLAAMILMPSEYILKHSRDLYHKIVSQVGFDNVEIVKKFSATELADHYEVSLQTMKNRLAEWPIKVIEKIDEAMQNRLDFLD